MYWVRKQISIHCGVGLFKEGETLQKVYFGHVSQDNEHDQAYTALSLDDALNILPVSDTLFLHSDNVSNFKSAQAFHDARELSNKWKITVVRIYGTAGHGKDEVDSAGGHLKYTVRKHISKGNNIRSAGAVETYLTTKYDQDKYTNPIYHVTEIPVGNWRKEEKSGFTEDMTEWLGLTHSMLLYFILGKILSLHHADYVFVMIVYTLNLKNVLILNSIFHWWVNLLRSKQGQNLSLMKLLRTQCLLQQTLFAIRADSEINNYFLLMCDEGEQEHNDPTKPLEDASGHKIYDGSKYVVGRYLEYETFNNRCNVYKVTKSKVLVAVDFSIYTCTGNN